MNISSNSWHFRLYAFNKKLLERFRGNTYWYEDVPKRVNLCPYMRTILIWEPMLYLFYSLTYFILLGTFLLMPLTMVGTTDGTWLVSVIFFFLMIGAAGAGFIYGMTRVGSFVSAKRKEAREAREAAGIVEQPNGFFKVLKAYWRSFHDKTCFALDVK